MIRKIKNHFSHTRVAIISVIALTLQLLVPATLVHATAGVMTYTMVRTDRMNASQATTGTVCAKPTTTATEALVAITFPTGYTVGVLTNWTVSTATTTSWPKDPADGTTSATAWPSIANTGTGTGVSGQTVTLASGDLTVGTWYCFNWTNTAALTNKSSATSNNTGTVVTETSAPAAIDTGNYATATVAASCGSVGCDQIAVTATVNASFAFSLSANTAALGTLSTSGTAASAINASVSTNAQKGWNMWAADPAGTPGLTSSTASKTIAYSPAAGSAAHTLSAEEGYNLGVGTSAGGTCNGATTIDGNFASGGTSFRGGGLDNTPRIFATGTGTANACLIPLTVNAMITATTPAASDYAGTMTVIAAGRF